MRKTETSIDVQVDGEIDAHTGGPAAPAGLRSAPSLVLV
jgi:hypothetical protein